MRAEECKKRDLQCKNERHEYTEFPFAGFMMKAEHSADTSDASANQGKKEEDGLRNAELVIFCLVFVDAEQKPRGKIHDHEIAENKLNRCHNNTL